MVSEKRQQEWIKDLEELRSVKAENEKLIKIKQISYEAICTGDKEASEKAIDLMDDFDKPSNYIVHVINSHKKLVDALKKYGDHLPGCVKGDACNCGFEQALKSPKEK